VANVKKLSAIKPEEIVFALCNTIPITIYIYLDRLKCILFFPFVTLLCTSCQGKVKVLTFLKFAARGKKVCLAIWQNRYVLLIKMVDT
jgi:hypothetical protein